MSAFIDFFLEAKVLCGCISALGIGGFGPVELNHQVSDYRSIKKTPKPSWSGTNPVSFFEQKLNVPVFLDADVNAAALGEYTQGHCPRGDNFVHVTVGIGIGAGAMSDDKRVQGVTHMEVGHMLVPRHASDLNAASNCPFHKKLFGRVGFGRIAEFTSAGHGKRFTT